MKTMEKLLKQFRRMYPEYQAELDWLDSYEGWYTVVITEPVCDIPAYYHFRTTREFSDWMHGVVLD